MTSFIILSSSFQKPYILKDSSWSEQFKLIFRHLSLVVAKKLISSLSFGLFFPKMIFNMLIDDSNWQKNIG